MVREPELYTQCKEALARCLVYEPRMYDWNQDYLAILSQLSNPNKDATTVGQEVAKISEKWPHHVTRSCFCALMMVIKQQLDSSMRREAESSRKNRDAPPSPPRIHNNIIVKMDTNVRTFRMDGASPSSASTDIAPEFGTHALNTPQPSPRDDQLSSVTSECADVDSWFQSSDKKPKRSSTNDPERPKQLDTRSGSSPPSWGYINSDTTICFDGGDSCELPPPVPSYPGVVRSITAPKSWTTVWTQPTCPTEVKTTAGSESSRSGDAVQRLSQSDRVSTETSSTKPTGKSQQRKDPWTSRRGTKEEVDGITSRIWQNCVKTQERKKKSQAERLQKEEEQRRKMFQPNINRRARDVSTRHPSFLRSNSGPEARREESCFERLYNNAYHRPEVKRAAAKIKLSTSMIVPPTEEKTVP
jgi:hypothetical protein